MSWIDNNRRELKSLLVSREGYKFRMSDDAWRLSRDTTVHHRVLKALLSPNLYQGYIKTLSVFAHTHSPRTVLCLSLTFLRLLKFAGDRPVNGSLLIAYRREEGVTGNTLGYLRMFFSKWIALDYPGANREVCELLKSWTLRGGITGDAVKRMDPREGPLTDGELQGLLEGLAHGYESGAIDVNYTSVVMLLQATGRRRNQVADLRLKDFVETPTIDGGRSFFVSVPRIKQRAGGFRKEFRRVAITEELWQILQLQRKHVRQRFTELLSFEVPEDMLDELPVYFSESRVRSVHSLSDLIACCSYDYLHIDRGAINQMLNIALGHCKVLSERTGRRLYVTPTRFRYTLGTRAARAGFGLSVIAELLDHSSTNYAHVYMQNVPEHGAVINGVVGEHLTPYANTFAGVVVDHKSLARRGGEAGSDIRDLAGKGAGTCGHAGVCGAAVPIPCYTCPHFQAWLEGPHEALYEELVRERAEILELTGDAAVAMAHDRTILAVAQVIDACNTRKGAL